MDTLILNKDGNPLCMFPLSIVSWQTAIKLVALEKVVTIKEYNDWVVSSPTTKINVPSIVMTTEYVKWNHKTKFSRSNVYIRDNFSCQYCGKQFDAEVLTLDHVVPKSHGGKTNWTNISTACKKCNNAKGNESHMRPIKMPHKPSYFELVARRQEYPITIREEEWKYYLPWKDSLIYLTRTGEHRTSPLTHSQAHGD